MYSWLEGTHWFPGRRTRGYHHKWVIKKNSYYAMQTNIFLSYGHKHTHLCVSFPNTLHSWCEKPWGPSKVDGLISQRNTHRLDQHFYIIFLRPTHLPLSHIWQECLRSDVTHYIWQSNAKFFFCYSPMIATHLFLVFLLQSTTVDSSLVPLKSTWSYRNLKSDFDYTHMNTIWKPQWFLSVKAVAHVERYVIYY